MRSKGAAAQVKDSGNDEEVKDSGNDEEVIFPCEQPLHIGTSLGIETLLGIPDVFLLT